MKYTENYNLKLPDYEDPQDIKILNENAEFIDMKMKEIESKEVEVTKEKVKNALGYAPVKSVNDMTGEDIVLTGDHIYADDSMFMPISKTLDKIYGETTNNSKAIGEFDKWVGDHQRKIASPTELGHVKIGNNLTIDENGVLSTTGRVDVVDNLTTDDGVKALSARQGVVINGKINTMVNSLDELTDGLNTKMDKSGGTFTGDVNMGEKELTSLALKHYGEGVEKLLSDSSLSVNIYSSNVFLINITTNTKIYFNNLDGQISNTIQPFTLYITNTNSHSITFNSTIRWANGEIPDLTGSGTHIVSFVNKVSGTDVYIGDYFAFYGGMFDV